MIQGQKIPEFFLENQDGKKITFPKKGTVVLYFYPKDDTPGCTAQACNLKTGMQTLKGITVFGISGDDKKSHIAFKQKYSLPFDLLVDTNNTIAKMFGVWGEKSFFGKKYMTILRTTFIVKDGIIVSIIKNVNVLNHSKQILEQINKA